MEKYTRIRELGTGGMSKVFLVQEVATSKLWAMKELQSKNQSEADCLSKFHHPHIPRMREYLPRKDTGYIIMDYIEGESLTQYIQANGQVCEHIVVDWMFQLLDIIDFLHAQGCIYCDLKPENIMISKNGTLYLIDFGVAIRKDTQAKMHYGTVGYAAPEQYGDAMLDERVDIYGFGKVMLAALSGVYKGDEVEQLSITDLSVSDWLKDILRQCMQEQAEDRYGDVKQLLYDLKYKKRKLHIATIYQKVVGVMAGMQRTKGVKHA